MRLTIPGRPVPAARMTQNEVKVALSRNRRGHPLTPKDQRIVDYEVYKQDVALAVLAGRLKPVQGNLVFTARIYLKANKDGDLSGIRGDLSNYVKALEDGLQQAGIIPNDKQIIRYGEGTGIYPCREGEERAEVEISQVGRETDGQPARIGLQAGRTVR
jgi:Holliday junction resolvase RusA-like endonuclease